MKRFLYLVGLSSSLMGCDNSDVAVFDEFSVRRPHNLQRLLGENVTLVSPTDTLQLHIQYNAQTGVNTVIRAPHDTVIQGQVLRYRGLYYVVEPYPSAASSFIHAIRLRPHSVQGLNTSYLQTQALLRDIRHGKWAEAVRFRNAANDSFRLRFDARILHSFYKQQLDSFPQYQIQAYPPPVLQRSATAVTPPAPTLHPNPANTQATLTWEAAAARDVQLYTLQGQLLRTYAPTTTQLAIPTTDLPTGTYVLRIAATPAAAAASIRLVVRH